MTELKEKIVLKEKDAVAQLPTVEQLIVKLGWTSEVDLDLMAFYEMKDGGNGGVFSNEISQDEATLGDLNAFPFIKLSGDAGVGAAAGEKVEEMKIIKLDQIAKLHIIALNYTDRANNDASFSSYNGHIDIMDDKGNAFEVPLTSTEKGCVAHIATIDNTSPIGATLKMMDSVMSIGQMVETIAGAVALTK